MFKNLSKLLESVLEFIGLASGLIGIFIFVLADDTLTAIYCLVVGIFLLVLIRKEPIINLYGQIKRKIEKG